MWILLITWFLHGTPDTINSYQISFETAEACNTAKQNILAEELRLRNQIYADALAQEKVAAPPLAQKNLFVVGSYDKMPRVTAVCTAH